LFKGKEVKEEKNGRGGDGKGITGERGKIGLWIAINSRGKEKEVGE
jgi:hypothetical protein